jgi:ferredoxin
VRYVVVAALCSGHGQCAAAAEKVYLLDGEGYNSIVTTEVEVPAGLEHDAEAGADACPEQAIRILG